MIRNENNLEYEQVDKIRLKRGEQEVVLHLLLSVQLAGSPNIVLVGFEHKSGRFQILVDSLRGDYSRLP